jgi:hypothetical protein
MAKRENGDTNKTLMENFVSLQRVMTNLSLKLDNLATQISKLLELFEISAKTIAERGPQGISQGGQHGKELAGKIDRLIEQNKTIARGLALIHETGQPRNAEDYEFPRAQAPANPPRRNPLPVRKGFQQPMPQGRMKADDYQKSISYESGQEESNGEDEQDKQA